VLTETDSGTKELAGERVIVSLTEVPGWRGKECVGRQRVMDVYLKPTWPALS
jgi:hypothetical protein